MSYANAAPELPHSCNHPEPSRHTGINKDGSTFTECLDCATIIKHEKTPRSQAERILWFMRTNPQKEWWSASDFQKAPFFVGYEATARMAELLQKLPDGIEVKRVGRFRLIKLLRSNRQQGLPL